MNEIASSSTPPAAQSAALWLVWSNEHGAFWRPNSAGYTTSIDGAGRYTEAEAKAICGQRSKTPSMPEPEVMIPAPENGRAPDPSRAALVAALRDCLSTLSFYALGKQPSGLLRRGTVVKSPRLWATEAILAAEQALALADAAGKEGR